MKQLKNSSLVGNTRRFVTEIDFAASAVPDLSADVLNRRHGVSLPNFELLDGLLGVWEFPRGHGSSAGRALKMASWMRLSVAHFSEFDGRYRANQGTGVSCGMQRRPRGRNLVSVFWRCWRSRTPSAGLVEVWGPASRPRRVSAERATRWSVSSQYRIAAVLAAFLPALPGLPFRHRSLP